MEHFPFSRITHFGPTHVMLFTDSGHTEFGSAEALIFHSMTNQIAHFSNHDLLIKILEVIFSMSGLQFKVCSARGGRHVNSEKQSLRKGMASSSGHHYHVSFSGALRE